MRQKGEESEKKKRANKKKEEGKNKCRSKI